MWRKFTEDDGGDRLLILSIAIFLFDIVKSFDIVIVCVLLYKLYW